MSKRDWRVLADDIITSAEKIENYINGLSFEDFAANSMVVDAIVRNLEIIGEAASKISLEKQESLVDIPWKKLRGIRNRIVHEYFDVDIAIIWFIAKNEISELKRVFQKACSEN